MSSMSFHDPDFQRLLDPFRLPTIHVSDNTVYGVRPDLTLSYVNRGWSNFAAKNGGEPLISSQWGLGCCVGDAIPPVLQPFFFDNFAKCLRERRPWVHLYECSSAEVYRKFSMKSFPLGEGEGLLIVHSLVQESSHTDIGCEPLETIYRNEDGLIVQCCHCRRVRRTGKIRWDWVPAWLAIPPKNTSHGLCEPCFGYYYPPLRSLSSGFPEPFRTQNENLPSECSDD